MTLTITDQAMRSPETTHTAAPVADGWSVTWLPGRVLTRNEAITAMTLAELVGEIPPDAPPSAYSDKFWLHVDMLAGELGLSGVQAVTAVTA